MRAFRALRTMSAQGKSGKALEDSQRADSRMSLEPNRPKTSASKKEGNMSYKRTSSVGSTEDSAGLKGMRIFNLFAIGFGDSSTTSSVCRYGRIDINLYNISRNMSWPLYLFLGALFFLPPISPDRFRGIRSSITS